MQEMRPWSHFCTWNENARSFQCRKRIVVRFRADGGKREKM